MKRFPYWSNERLGAQHESPSTSSAPSPTSRFVQVVPPSKLTARNIPAVSPASAWPTFVRTTTLFGFVGLTAIASSDSFPARWLTSTLVGGAAFAAPGI